MWDLSWEMDVVGVIERGRLGRGVLEKMMVICLFLFLSPSSWGWGWGLLGRSRFLESDEDG